ncbi:MAG: beta strand repeat-containing protein, partial [Phycisphaerae bacterium]
GDIASFGAGGNSPVTVTIDQSGVTAAGITFNTMSTGGSYTIASGGAGDNLNLNGYTYITMNADATISAPIVGAGALNLNGLHTLTLSGSNTYTGGTIINSGATLYVSGSISGAVVDDGTFNLGSELTITDLTGSGTINLGDNNLIINATAADTFSGTLTNSAHIFRVASNSLTLTGNISGFSGVYDPIGNGTLTINASGLLNSIAILESQDNGILNVAYSNLNGNLAAFLGSAAGQINFTGTNATGTLGAIDIDDTSGTTTNTIDGGGVANTLTLGGPITSKNTTGSNTLILQNGTFVLTSTSNASTFIDNGTLQIGNNALSGTVQFTAATNLPGSSIGINMEGGELQFTGSGAVTIANAITDTSSNDIIDGGGLGNTLTLSNTITNATGSTLTAQNGIFVLTGTNNTTFSGGSLQ